MTGWAVIPYDGVDGLKFGMSPEQVAEALGPPSEITSNDLGEREERRDSQVPVIRYGDSGIVEFSFLPETPAIVDGENVFDEEDPVAFLLSKDPSPYECLGFLIFLNLGLTLTGYHDEDASQRAITVFARGRWEEMRDHFEAFGG
jgi:hypothetical protein